ncbi:MAG TPA: universal stress protein, partial [Thermoleophilia bacterium]|nr:universal stress protein [Thermoleophilia bacterium]
FSLTKTVKAVPLPEAVQADIDYDQLLVPIVGSRITDEMMVLACQLATEKQSSIDALYVIEVPLNLPLDARLPRERENAERVLEQAALVADQFKVKLNPIVVTARSAGRAIVDEARDRRSEVIILGVTRKPRFTQRAFGSTLSYVIEHASCEVLINLVPQEGVYAPDGGQHALTTAVATPGGDGAGAAGGVRVGDGGTAAGSETADAAGEDEPAPGRRSR